MSTSSTTQFPTAALVRILYYSDPADYSNLSLVCKSFHKGILVRHFVDASIGEEYMKLFTLLSIPSKLSDKARLSIYNKISQLEGFQNLKKQMIFLYGKLYFDQFSNEEILKNTEYLRNPIMKRAREKSFFIDDQVARELPPTNRNRLMCERMIKIIREEAKVIDHIDLPPPPTQAKPPPATVILQPRPLFSSKQLIIGGAILALVVERIAYSYLGMNN